jgi:hypothetical protein
LSIHWGAFFEKLDKKIKKVYTRNVQRQDVLNYYLRRNKNEK